ncbi:hypothetical protein TSOC_007496 [Tetrabaena socialis]|uniref:MYND-type domain-containing protein n=1 Tax=Tetrabaena socialis TaxID=47790 RepID=A0A2J8A0W9_9CHLO|nr:hypothetical protein TSOC_007496 [Tetrabaena socialis]|eukprot:PNH06169.1 hypothetical protein TSOC_007496 [Tetrabaena socialis]
MAAAAESSLEEDLRRLRGLIDAATSNDPRSAEPAQSMRGRSRQHPRSAAWAKPLHQHGIVPAAAGLLQHMLQTAYRQSPGGLGVIAYGAPSAPVEGSKADPLNAALSSVQAVAETVEAAASAFVAGIDMPGGGPAATAVRAAACELWGQLAAPATLQALADAVRWVEAAAWPAEHAVAAAAAGAGSPTQQPPAVGKGPVGALEDIQLQGSARRVLLSVALVVRVAVSLSGSLLSPAVGTGAPSAASVPAAPAASQRALLAALRDSGVLSALSAAVLSAPPCPEVAADAKALDAATAATAMAQYHVFSALWELSQSIAPWVGLRAATELLAAPDVRRLRWAALEQLAAAAAEAGGSRMGAAGGGVTGAGGEAGARWLLLLQPHVVRHTKAMGGRLVCGYASLMGAALDAPARWLCGSQPLAEPGAGPPDTATSLSAAKRLLPPPRRLAALAASCARTVCAEVEAELRALTAGAAAVPAGPGDGDAGGVGGTANVLEQCLLVVEQLRNLALTLSAVSAGESLPDLLESCGWALRAQAAAMAVDWSSAACREGEGGHLSPALCAGPVIAELAFRLKDWTGFSAAAQAACMQRLLPTGLMQSVDCLLRWLAATGMRGEDERITARFCLVLLVTTLIPVLRAHVAAPRARDVGHGGSVWRPQDVLGLLVSAAKLARREAEAEQPGGLALVPHPNSNVLVLPPAHRIAIRLATVALEMVTLVTGLTQKQQRSSRSSSATTKRSAEAAVALREAIALVSLAALPILQRVAVRDLRCPGGSDGGGGSSGGRGGGGGGRAHGASGMRGSSGGDGRFGGLALGAQSRARMMMSAPTDGATDDCCESILAMGFCLTAAVQLLPPADLLALQPQRALAQLALLLQRAHELRQPGAGQGSRGVDRGGGGGRGTLDGGPPRENELSVWADEVAGALVHMAADEQLVGAVAGWLREEAAALPQPGQASALAVHPQGLCGDLDVRALATALRHWNVDAAVSIDRLHAAAASSAPAAGRGCECGGSSSKGPGAAASGDGAAAPLLAAARAAIALRHETALWSLRDGGAGGYPSWPPRVLRLCGNPACRNFAGPAEGDLPLHRCSGCKAVRYCGTGCQKQHWRDGRHKEACACLRAVTPAAMGGG